MSNNSPASLKTCTQVIQRDDNLLQHRSLLTQCLGSIRLVPYIGLFKLALNFGQALRLAVVVKDTPSTR